MKNFNEWISEEEEAYLAKKEKIQFGPFSITIENRKNTLRSGISEDGIPWNVKMPVDYGYFNSTTGADEDGIDVYVGPNSDSEIYFIIDQVDDDLKFDEHKCMVGFDNIAVAKSTYAQAFSDDRGLDRIGAIAELSLKDFQKWLSQADYHDAPFLYQCNDSDSIEEGFIAKTIGTGAIALSTLLNPLAHGSVVTPHHEPAVTNQDISKDVEIVAATLIGEAGGEGDDGMRGVLNVIMNRANHDFSSASKVCLKKSQFSMWNGKVVSDVVAKAKKHPKWDTALVLVKIAQVNKLKDNTDGADFYFNPKLVLPSWAHKFVHTTSIKNHAFYKHQGNVASFK